MEDERNQPLPSPRGFRFKFWKIMTLTFLILVGLSAVSFAGIKTTSSSKFCSSCHEMKPEYYTWKASTHSEVECDNCHIAPGGKNLVKEKKGLVKEVFRSVTNTYTAPIQMPTEIPNEACEKCHNMSTRTVSPSGDLIIPHDKHSKEGIKCTQCHSSVAHGKVAERKVSFKADYEKWDEEQGHSIMSEVKFTKPTMETCMDCHQNRDITIECSACHTTGMYPESHATDSFKSSMHGKLAKEDLKECNSCHQYMSSVNITVFAAESAFSQFLRKEHTEKSDTTKGNVEIQSYAKENTFCRDCHGKKPSSHDALFIGNHGDMARKDDQKCLVCHEYERSSDNPVTTATCSGCHPSSHVNKNFKENHPLPLGENQKVTETCYSCHVRSACSRCHKS